MAVLNRYVVLTLCVVLSMSYAFPQNNFENATEVYSTTEQSSTVSNNRQGRADLSTIARFVNPTNLAQFKNLFSGGASALSSVLSFNIGNLVVLSLLAGTALLIAPALLSLFGLGGSFGAIGRSLGLGNFATGKSGDNKNTMTVSVFKAIDDFAKTYNVDVPVCMQRFACTAAKKSAIAYRQGTGSYVDATLNFILNSNYLNSTLGQTRFMDAVKFGKNEGSCEIEYGKCPFSWEKVAQYLPSFGYNPQSNVVPQHSTY